MVISSLIGSWSAKSIVSQIAKKFPKVAPYIGKASQAGFAAPSILKALFGKNQRFYTPEAEIDKRREKTKKNIVKSGLSLVAGLGAASLAGKAAGTAIQAAEDLEGAALPPGSSPPPVAPTPSKMDALVGPVGTGQPTSPPTPREQLTQNIQTVASKLPSKIEKDYPYFPVFVKKHIETGMSPQEVYEKTKQSGLYAPLVQKHEQQTGESFLSRIEEMAGKGNIKKPSNMPQGIALTPFGAGEVHKTHNGNAYVEVNKKLHKVPEQEIEQPPQDVVKAVSDILKIPEIDRSSNVALFLYDPEESKAVFQFHDGSAYKYLQIDPEVVRKVAEKEAIPITEGENVYGAWSPDDPHGSLGAALWAYILKDPKYAKNKKDQPVNPYYKKLETLYDYWKDLRIKKRKK